MRGKPKQTSRKPTRSRITPADAGKTSSAEIAPVSAEDHPRGCGENPIIRVPIAQRQGSPPRMRGKRSGFRVNDSCKRITPADAGKTKLHLSYFFTL